MTRPLNNKNTFSEKIRRDNGIKRNLMKNEIRKRTGHPLIPVPEQTRFEMPMKKCPSPNCNTMIKATWLCCDDCRAKMNELKKVHSLSK